MLNVETTMIDRAEAVILELEDKQKNAVRVFAGNVVVRKLVKARKMKPNKKLFLLKMPDGKMNMGQTYHDCKICVKDE